MFTKTVFEDFCNALRNGLKVEAIKIYRNVMSVDLRDAKNAVEDIHRGGYDCHKRRIEDYQAAHPGPDDTGTWVAVPSSEAGLFANRAEAVKQAKDCVTDGYNWYVAKVTDNITVNVIVEKVAQ